MKKRRLASATGALAVLSLVAALAGCGNGNGAPDPGGTEGGSAEPYKWGINAELSGNVSYYGQTLEAGVKAYVDQVNAAGGIDGHPIELVTLDNAGEAARSATNATQLATADQVNAMFGFVLSANCSAATPVVERHQVPLACLSTVEPNEYVFSLGPNSTLMGGAILEAAKELSGKADPKVALLHVNTLTVAALAKSIQEKAAGVGVDLVETQEVDLAASDASSQVARIVASEPDAVIISNFGPGFLMGLRGLRAAGLDVPVVWADGTGNLNSLEESSDENVYAMSAYRLVQPDSDGVAADFIEAISPSLPAVDPLNLNAGYAAMAYVTAKAFGDGLAECGYPCSGPELQAVLAGLSADMMPMVDDFSYDNTLRYPYKNWYVYQVVGTEYTEVASFPHDPF